MRVRYGDGLVTFEVGDDSAVALAVTKRELVEQATAATSRYSQYDGYYSGDEWVLVRVLRSVTTKGGHAFDAGETALAKPSPREVLNGCEILPDGWTVWSPKREGNVFLGEGSVAVIKCS